MKATIKLEKNHFPVLLDELINIISPLYGGTFIDCTYGQGGYSKKILENNNNKIIALDRDSKVAIKLEKIKKKYKKRFKFYNTTFSNLNRLDLKNVDLKAIIFDLGYSINQINDDSKGLSFNHKGKLNMRMGINEFSANEAVNKLSEEDLKKIFKFFGEEIKARSLAKQIVLRRKISTITTENLVNIVEKVKKGKRKKIHNSTKTFQALRIFVNQEISQLIMGLINGFSILPIGGMIIVITFNSIEDKIVKFFFRHYCDSSNSSRYQPESKNNKKLFNMPVKKPILPSEHEIKKNPPSRTAKLRYAIKIKEETLFTEFINRFKYLTDIEKLSKNL